MCADFPTKSRYDVIDVSSGDVLMMWGFWMMTFTSQSLQGWGYKRINAKGKGFPVLTF